MRNVFGRRVEIELSHGGEGAEGAKQRCSEDVIPKMENFVSQQYGNYIMNNITGQIFLQCIGSELILLPLPHMLTVSLTGNQHPGPQIMFVAHTVIFKRFQLDMNVRLSVLTLFHKTRPDIPA